MGARRERQWEKKGVSCIGRYIYRPIDKHARLFFMRTQKKVPLAQYAALRRRLAKISWISQGYVQDRGPGAGGPCYQWTRKVKGKTVSVALSKEQYQWLRSAIGQWRQVQETLQQMQRLSRQVLDRKSTRLNSSHLVISYAVFCLKKKT